MDLGLSGKIVVVSGGGGRRGSVGETIVRAIAREGGIPVILDMDPRGAHLMADLNASGQESFFVESDLMTPEGCEKAIGTTLDQYGRIDAVVNNLGSNDNVGLDGSYEEFINSLKLNLIHLFLLVKHSRDALVASQGNILSIGSKVAASNRLLSSGTELPQGGPSSGSSSVSIGCK